MNGDCWPAASTTLKGAVAGINVFAGVAARSRATSQWLSHVHIVKRPCCHPMQLGPGRSPGFCGGPARGCVGRRGRPPGVHGQRALLSA